MTEKEKIEKLSTTNEVKAEGEERLKGPPNEQNYKKVHLKNQTKKCWYFDYS